MLYYLIDALLDLWRKPFSTTVIDDTNEWLTQHPDIDIDKLFPPPFTLDDSIHRIGLLDAADLFGGHQRHSFLQSNYFIIEDKVASEIAEEHLIVALVA